jgi:hypothetical protein
MNIIASNRLSKLHALLHLKLINPLNPGHFYEFLEFRKFIKISPVSITKVKPFYSGRIASKLMAKHTSLLTKNTAFEHKFHIDTRKWQKL